MARPRSMRARLACLRRQHAGGRAPYGVLPARPVCCCATESFNLWSSRICQDCEVGAGEALSSPQSPTNKAATKLSCPGGS